MKRSGRGVPIIIVVGGQYGSEGKGMVTGYLAIERKADYAVRTGGINAGHTVYHKGKPYAMQQIPTAWVNPFCTLVLGAGALVHAETLAKEIVMVSEAMGEDIKKRLLIDWRCVTHREDHRRIAQTLDRHTRIGATGKGVAEAVADRVLARGGARPEDMLFRFHAMAQDLRMADTTTMLNAAYDIGQTIILEGTQGTALDLVLGPWPYTTSRMTTAAALMAEAGLSPALDTEIIMVLRTYPIRVAGNSGPMYREIDWPILMRRINSKLALRRLPPRVKEASIQAFEEAVRDQGLILSIPYENAGGSQYAWTDPQRETYARALSVMNAAAMEFLRQTNIETYNDLRRTMEMTTVTGKPRRISEFDETRARGAIAVERPHKIALTFLNYELPHLWDEVSLDDDKARGVLRGYMDLLDVPIAYVTTGANTLLTLGGY